MSAEEDNKEKKAAHLKEVGRRINMLDEHLVSLIKRRIELSTLVIDAKGNDPIVVPEREDERIRRVGEIAKSLRLDRHSVEAVLSQIINTGVKHQTMIRDGLRQDETSVNPGDRSKSALRNNLLRLTAHVALSYDEHQDCPATNLCYSLEDQIIKDAITSLMARGRLLDLGSATGRMVFNHKVGFRSIRGIDISSDMNNVARLKINPKEKDKIKFVEHDLEDGIPEDNESVSMIIMNNGTGSDIDNIEKLLTEAERVLVKGGIAYLSFYNKNALVHQSVLPWQNSVSAVFNPVFDTLEVEISNARGTMPIFARPYSISQVRELIERRLMLKKITSFPFITSILPREILSGSSMSGFTELDRRLALEGDESGAYIVTVSQKV